MIAATLDAGVAAAFMTGYDVYRNDAKLRAALHTRGVGYVLAVACNHRIPGPRGPIRNDEVTRGFPGKSLAGAVRGSRQQWITVTRRHPKVKKPRHATLQRNAYRKTIVST